MEAGPSEMPPPPPAPPPLPREERRSNAQVDPLSDRHDAPSFEYSREDHFAEFPAVQVVEAEARERTEAAKGVFMDWQEGPRNLEELTDVARLLEAESCLILVGNCSRVLMSVVQRGDVSQRVRKPLSMLTGLEYLPTGVISNRLHEWTDSRTGR